MNRTIQTDLIGTQAVDFTSAVPNPGAELPTIDELLGCHPVDSVIVDKLGHPVWHTRAFFEKFDADFVRDLLLRLDYEVPAASHEGRCVFNLLYSPSAAEKPRPFTVAAQKAQQHHWVVTIVDGNLIDAEASRTEREHAVLTKMLAVFAHEFRNPLVAAELATELMQESAHQQQSASASSLSKLDAVGNSIRQMKRLLDDLEDYHRFSRGKIAVKKQIFDLRQVLSELVDERHQRGDTHIRLHSDRSAPALTNGDVGRIQQVFANVIGNAVKFSPGNTPIDIYLERTGSGYEVHVVDQGLGMNSNTLGHIAKPFFQVSQGVSREPGGLGLGTYICRTLVDLHQGTMQYRSDGVGRGTHVTITLPESGSMCRDPANTNVLKRRQVDTVKTGEKEHTKVLIVEDHQSCLDAYRMALEDCSSAEVHYAASGAEALSLLRQHLFSLVITDLGLPDVSGYDLIEAFHAETKCRLPTDFVLVTGYGSDDERNKSKALGFSEHIVKPLPLDKLRSLVMNSSSVEAAANGLSSSRT